MGLGQPLVANAQVFWIPRRSPPSGPEPSRPLTSNPRCLSVLSDAVLSGSSCPRSATAVGPGWQGSAGARAEAPNRISASAERRRARQSVSHLPRSLSLYSVSGPGALRLRTFHSSFHAPSLGHSLIGSSESDVTALLPPPASGPAPPSSRFEPERAIGAPHPQRMAAGGRGGEELLGLCAHSQPLAATLIPNNLPAISNPLPFVVLTHNSLFL